MLFLRKQTLSFQYTDSLYVVINLKNLVVKLACGDYNCKYSEWKIMKNVILNVVFSLRLVYLRIISVCIARSSIYIVVTIKIKYNIHAREPLYSNSAVIAWWSQSTGGKNGVFMCTLLLKNVVNFLIFYF